MIIITTELPVYKIRDKYYYYDKRLNEYRNVENPNDRFDMFEVRREDLQEPSKKDKDTLWKKILKR